MSSDFMPLRPSWVEVDLSAIENNARLLAQIAAPADLLTMVKANAYGHGAVETSRAALRGGANWLGVYAMGEGVELRRANIDAPILVVGPTQPEYARIGVEQHLTLTIFSMEQARAISDAARELSVRAHVHLKVDTGMARLGVMPEQAVDFARAVRELPDIEIEGVFTHFAMADTPDAFGIQGWGIEYTQKQFERFRSVIAALENAGIDLRYRHCANSPATLNLAEARFNLVRSGILLYGLDPSPEVPQPYGFRPALSFKTQVALVKIVPTGTYVSYGATFRTERPTHLAVLMVGYGDGFRRKPNYGEVLVHGKRAPIVGRVCMDQTMIDVTDIEGVQAGDEVVLIGRQGQEEIRAEEVAEKLGTNNYETVTTISARVERRYV
ncbi:MAG: alanine racemase [Chloroflexi bacterium]|nr:alanine racemase [Chloroflexota bacterium]